MNRVINNVCFINKTWLRPISDWFDAIFECLRSLAVVIIFVNFFLIFSNIYFLENDKSDQH